MHSWQWKKFIGLLGKEWASELTSSYASVALLPYLNICKELELICRNPNSLYWNVRPNMNYILEKEAWYA
jgi:hypothetical protein